MCTCFVSNTNWNSILNFYNYCHIHQVVFIFPCLSIFTFTHLSLVILHRFCLKMISKMNASVFISFIVYVITLSRSSWFRFLIKSSYRDFHFLNWKIGKKISLNLVSCILVHCINGLEHLFFLHTCMHARI